MNPEQLAAQLAPLRPPDPVAWWPPAIGWWVLSVALLAVLAALLYLGLRRYRRNRYRRLALGEIERLQRAGELSAASLNRLLKTTAVTAFPADTIAGKHGEPWIEFLDTRCRRTAKDDLVGLANPYTPEQAAVPTRLVEACRTWIKHHEVGRV